MRTVESSMPTAIILLSWGWKARYVAAGGGDMKVVIVCNFPTKFIIGQSKESVEDIRCSI
jgi:hypothetical protein